MKSATQFVATAAVVAVVLFAASAIYAQERSVTNDPDQEFPRWHAFANVLNYKDSGTGNRITLADARVTVDKAGVMHLVGGIPDTVAGGGVGYVNSEWRSRRANGFSDPVSLAGPTASLLGKADLDAGPTGEIWVIYAQFTNPPANTFTTAFYRKKAPGGPWGAPTPILVGSPGGGATFDFITAEQIVVDGAGTAHVILSRSTDAVGPPSGLLYVSVAGAPGAPVSIAANGGYAFPRINANAAGTASVVFSDSGSLKHSTPAGAAAATVATADWGDVAVDAAGSPYFAYSAFSATAVKYRKVGDPEETVSALGVAVSPGDVRIHLDSRTQANVLWSYNVGVDRIAYARRIAGAWLRQEPIKETERAALGTGGIDPGEWPLGLLDFEIGPTDALYLSDGKSGLASWTYEPNLGSQDSFGSFGWGPGASASGVTGNMDFRLGLFSSRGVGYAVSLALVYNSAETNPHSMSAGWSHNCEMWIEEGATTATLVDSPTETITLRFMDGRRAIFRFNVTHGVYLADDEYAIFSKLERVAEASTVEYSHSRYLLTTKFGEKYTFRGDGKLERIEDTNSNTLDFHYTAGMLSDIEDSVRDLVATQPGRKTLFSYNPAGQIIGIRDPKAASDNYILSYDPEGRVESINFAGATPQVVTWTFTYHPFNDNLAGFRQGLLDLVRTPRGTAAIPQYATSYRWHPDNRAKSATDPEVLVITNNTADAAPVLVSPVRSLSYSDVVGFPPAATFTDRRGFDTTIEFLYRRALVAKLTDELGKFLLRTFDASFRNLTQFQDKRGFKTNYAYHATATPAWVKDILFTIERPIDASTFLPAIEYQYTTDGLNRVASVKDARGNSTTYAYTPEGNLKEIHHPSTTLVCGPAQLAVETYDYTGVTRGRVNTYTDAEGGVSTYVYEDDANTGLATRVREHGQALADAAKAEFDKLGNLVKVTAAPNNLAGGVTEYVLDGLYRVDLEKDPFLNTIDRTFDENSNVVQVVDRRGNTSLMVFDRRDQISSVTTPAGTSSFTYDREGMTRRSTDNRGFTSKTLYDELGRAKETRLPGAGTAGGGGQEMVTSFDLYDENGNLKQVTEAPGGGNPRTTTHEYDARNNRTKTVHPVIAMPFPLPAQEPVDRMTFDENDNLLAAERLDGTVFQSGSASILDERNRVVRSVQLTVAYVLGNPTGPRASILYDQNSNRTQVWNANNVPSGGTCTANDSTAYQYDLRQRLFKSFNGLSEQTMETAYWEDNSRKEVKTPEPITNAMIVTQSFLYTSRKALFQEFDALGKFTEMAYDANGNVTSRKDKLGNQVTYVYDSSDRVDFETQYPATLNIQTSYTYDANSNRKTVTVFNPAAGANSATYVYEFDQANRMEKMTTPLGCFELWTYTDHGEVATHQDANGKVQTNTWDEIGRLKTEAHGAPFGVTITRQYDASGNMTQIEDGTAAITSLFNSLNRLTDRVWVVNAAPYKSVSYTYFDSGDRATMTDPESAAYVYTLDNDTRLQDLQRNSVVFASWQYDAGSRKKQVTLKNGAVTKFEYTQRSETLRVRTETSGSALLASYLYGYNDRGDRTSQVREHLGETISYGYDDAMRLVSESSTGSTISGPLVVPPRTISWEYDNAGNRKKMTKGLQIVDYVCDADNRLTSETSSTQGGGGGGGTVQHFGTVVVSSTAIGRNPAVLSDSDLTDDDSATYAWHSSVVAPGQIYAGLDFGSAVSLSKLDYYIPTGTGGPFLSGMRLFKVQTWTGTAWADVNVTSIVGAQAALVPGWYRTLVPTQHLISVEFNMVSASRIRVLMALGALLTPRLMRGNEIQAFGPSTPPPPQPDTDYIASYTYDCNGNQLTRGVVPVGAPVSSETFAYDYANRLGSYVKTGPVSASFNYLYAPSGERLNKLDVSASETEWYMLDGEDVVTDYSQVGAGSLAHEVSYVQPAMIDSKVARIMASGGAEHFYVPDALGSVTHLLDASQVIVNSEATDAWGNVVASSAPVVDRYGFMQRERETESGLVHMRARSYDPRVGRFLQLDPISSNMIEQHYAYSPNPISYVDPRGTQSAKVDEKGELQAVLSGVSDPTLAALGNATVIIDLLKQVGEKGVENLTEQSKQVRSLQADALAKVRSPNEEAAAHARLDLMIRSARLLLIEKRLEQLAGKPGKPVPAHVVDLLAPVFPATFDFAPIRLIEGVPWWLPAGNDAITLGTSIRIRPATWNAHAGPPFFGSLEGTLLVSHELFHVYQWRNFALGQVGWYVAYIMAAIDGTNRDHAFEKPAYAFSDPSLTQPSAMRTAIESALKSISVKNWGDVISTDGTLDKQFKQAWKNEVRTLAGHVPTK